jgi:DNA-binding helix-hairpin-helix protein with protein kinase domain
LNCPLEAPLSSQEPKDTLVQAPIGVAPTMRGGPSPKHPTLEAPLLGRWLAEKYEITGVIGRGGLGTVYRGVQHPIGREVAVKVINPDRASDPTLRQRFTREASAAAALKHPNIVALYDYGEDAGELYMVMELLDGQELRAILDEADHKRFEPAYAIELTQQICEGLAHAHERGLVHRDLKPENIMVAQAASRRPRVRVLDFGIVKVIRDDALAPGAKGHETRAGVVIGTPGYMAPEQAYARGIDRTTDQYSLGVMLYEMLAGRLPFNTGSDFEIMTAHCIKPIPVMPVEANVPPPLEAAVRKAMSKDRSDRYPTIQAFASALEEALHADPTPVVEPAPRRWPWVVGGLAVTACAIAAIAAIASPDEGSSTVDGGPLAALDSAASMASAARASAVLAAPKTAAPITTVAPESAAPKTLASVASVAPKSAAPKSLASAVAKQPRTPKPRRVRVSRIQNDCASELTAIRNSSKHQSLSKGSGLCRRLDALGKRVRAGRCKKPVGGISMLLALCEE